MPTRAHIHFLRFSTGHHYIVCVCLLLATALLLLFPRPSDAALRKITLQLHWQNQFEFAGYYAAVEQGFYKDEGLEVTILEGGPGIVPLTQMLQGKAEFAIGGSEMLLARLRGQPVIALASVFQHSAATLLVRSDSGIYTPQDLAGRVVEMGDLESDAEIHALLMNEGLTSDKIIHVPTSFAMDNIISKKVEALSSYLSNQPYFLKKASIPYRLLRPLWYGIDFYGDALFTTENIASQSPDMVEAFTRASMKGWTYALNHPDEMIQLILAKYPPSLIPRTQEHLWFEYQEVKKLILPTVIEIGHINPGRFRHMADTFVQLGLAKPGYDIKHFVYHSQQSLINWHSWQTQSLAYSIVTLLIVTTITLLYRKRIKKEVALRSLAETTLQRYEHRISMVLENTQSGYWEWNVEQDELFFDNRTARLLELSESSTQMSSKEIENSHNTNLASLFSYLKITMEKDTGNFDFEVESTIGPPTALRFKGETSYDDNHLSKRMAGTVTNVTPLRECLKELQELSVADPLDTTSNRRLFFQKAEHMFSHAQYQGTTIALSILEVDQLKSVIELNGFVVGNQLLQDFSSIVEAIINPQDILARIGNEEFFILSPNFDKTQAKDMLTTLRDNVGKYDFGVHTVSAGITFSAGVADTSELVLSEFRPRTLIAKADKRLHAARTSGKDKIITT